VANNEVCRAAIAWRWEVARARALVHVRSRAKIRVVRIFARSVRLTLEVHADTFRGSLTKMSARAKSRAVAEAVASEWAAWSRAVWWVIGCGRAGARGPIRRRVTAVVAGGSSSGAGPGRGGGGVAQLGERVNGIHEVRGSIPLASTREPGYSRGGRRAVSSVG
jgi:hypothetical protein